MSDEELGQHGSVQRSDLLPEVLLNAKDYALWDLAMNKWRTDLVPKATLADAAFQERVLEKDPTKLHHFVNTAAPDLVFETFTRLLDYDNSGALNLFNGSLRNLYPLTSPFMRTLLRTHPRLLVQFDWAADLRDSGSDRMSEGHTAFWMDVLAENGNALQYLRPPRLRTLALCQVAVNQNPEAAMWLPRGTTKLKGVTRKDVGLGPTPKPRVDRKGPVVGGDEADNEA
jgi:hypothetical protein